MMNADFKKEAEAVEKSLLDLFRDLDKVAEGCREWARPVVAPVDIDATKSKIMGELRKHASARNGALKAVFRQVDQPVGSTGE